MVNDGKWGFIIWLMVSTYPSEKWWFASSSLGMMTFHSQYDGKVRIHSMVPVTTNQISHLSNDIPMFVLSHFQMLVNTHFQSPNSWWLSVLFFPLIFPLYQYIPKSYSHYSLVNIQKTMERSTMFYGKIHYFDWAIFHCYVSSPEGIPQTNIIILINI